MDRKERKDSPERGKRKNGAQNEEVMGGGPGREENSRGADHDRSPTTKRGGSSDESKSRSGDRT